MNYQNYYCHGTAGFKGAFCALNRIESILKSGKISLDKHFNAIDAKYVPHGKRIYLCDPSKPILANLDSAMNLYISRGPSLILDKEIDVITPTYSPKYENQKREWTNLYDEVRANEDISLVHLQAITLPIDLIIKKYQVELLQYLEKADKDDLDILKNVIRPALETLNFMEKAFRAAKDFDSSLPIIDFLTGISITEETFEIIKNIINEKNYEVYTIKQLTKN